MIAGAVMIVVVTVTVVMSCCCLFLLMLMKIAKRASASAMARIPLRAVDMALARHQTSEMRSVLVTQRTVRFGIRAFERRSMLRVYQIEECVRASVCVCVCSRFLVQVCVCAAS